MELFKRRGGRQRVIAVVRKAMSLREQDRYQNVMDLWQDLEFATHYVGQGASSHTPFERAQPMQATLDATIPTEAAKSDSRPHTSFPKRGAYVMLTEIP